MGRVGAGASIEPEHEQVPPEGLGEVELPFPIAEETIAFEVAGDSMLPKYENGDVIVVFANNVIRCRASTGKRPPSGSRPASAISRRSSGENRHAGQPHEL